MTIKTDIINSKKPNEVVVDINYKETGKDTNGYPSYEIQFLNAPKNYKLVQLIEPLKCAVLEDLDYMEQ